MRVGTSLAESQTVGGVTRNITVNLGAGGDALRVASNMITMPFWAPQDLTINTQDGNDRVVLFQINIGDDLVVDLGEGSDCFRADTFYAGTLSGSTDHDLTVRGGLGRDAAELPVGTVRDDLRLEMGFDSAEDEVSLEDIVVFSDITILTGSGDDFVEIESVRAETLTVETGADTDHVKLKQIEVDELFARMGTGDDMLFARDAHARRADLNGGGGTGDFMGLTNLTADEDLDLFGFESGYVREEQILTL